ncbi:MAG: RNA-directed DNA polymerase [Planctomycetota bacterium]|jgi:RNA-directed DNA polymerase
MRGGWVLEADIRDFFGALDPTKLREIQRLRVQDGVMLRSLGKWLQTGVLENGRHHRPASGTPQG